MNWNVGQRGRPNVHSTVCECVPQELTGQVPTKHRTIRPFELCRKILVAESIKIEIPVGIFSDVL